MCCQSTAIGSRRWVIAQSCLKHVFGRRPRCVRVLCSYFFTCLYWWLRCRARSLPCLVFGDPAADGTHAYTHHWPFRSCRTQGDRIMTSNITSVDDVIFFSGSRSRRLPASTANRRSNCIHVSNYLMTRVSPTKDASSQAQLFRRILLASTITSRREGLDIRESCFTTKRNRSYSV